MARNHTFAGTKGYGYYAYIEDGDLVIGEDWPHEGGIIYRGTYENAGYYLDKIYEDNLKLYNSITKYYAAEAKKKETVKEESGVTYVFKDSGEPHYCGWIEDGRLVLGYNGGVYYQGSYTNAGAHLEYLKCADPVLYEDIEKYITKHGVKDESDLRALCIYEETKSILFNVMLHMDDGRTVHRVSVRGVSEREVISNLLSNKPEVLTLQLSAGSSIIAVRSEKISAVEFC